jgi:general secretion pathway protein A
VGVMYLSFFGLTEHPFNVTPDPRFLYTGSGHREALDRLQDGAHERGGFIVLTGEAGTGKTTLVHALRQRLDEDTAVSYVFNTTVPFDGIVEYILEDLGIGKLEESPAGRLAALSNFLVAREQAGQKTILILDEAHILSAATLEQISQLSRLENGPSKLVQVLLVGQPELVAKLDRPDLRHVRDRISLRCHVPPLDRGETHEYICRRLDVAGAPDVALFNDRAVKRIAKQSGGIPRVINILADHCLLFGYADQRRRIGRSIVNQAIAYLEETRRSPRMDYSEDDAGFLRRFGWIFGAVGVALASAVVGFVLAAL